MVDRLFLKFARLTLIAIALCWAVGSVNAQSKPMRGGTQARRPMNMRSINNAQRKAAAKRMKAKRLAAAHGQRSTPGVTR